MKYGVAQWHAYDEENLSFFIQKKKIQELTERLKFTELELKTLKSLQPSTAILVNELKDIWTIVNATAEKTLILTNKVSPIISFAWSYKKKLLATESLFPSLPSSFID